MVSSTAYRNSAASVAAGSVASEPVLTGFATGTGLTKQTSSALSSCDAPPHTGHAPLWPLRRRWLVILMVCCSALLASCAPPQTGPPQGAQPPDLSFAPPSPVRVHTPVRDEHIREIHQLFRTQGIWQGLVQLDNRGRLELQGAYDNEAEVDRAFSIAQTVVGVRWVSPVTPQRIKVKAWAQRFSDLFGAQGPGTTAESATPPGQIRRKFALVVGVGAFQHDISPLQYPAKDAEDIYKYLISPTGGGFQRQDVTLLRNAEVTRGAVLQALNRVKEQATADDLVVLYISSHGTPPDKFGGVHVVTYDTVVKPREQVWATSVNEHDLHAFIREVKARRFLMILDACYSNGAYVRIPGFLPPGGKSLDGDPDEGTGQSRQYMAERLLGMKGLTVEPEVVTPARTPHTWGKVLISASDSGEKSWELDVLRNGVFTYYFLEGLSRYQGSVKAAFDHARPAVAQKLRSEGINVAQTPQVVATEREWDILLTQGR